MNQIFISNALYICNSWVSRHVINFTGGQLQIDTQSLEENNFSLYVLTFCLAANMSNFVRFVHSSTVQSSIHSWVDPHSDLLQNALVKPKNLIYLYTKFVWPSKICTHSPLVLHFRIVLKRHKQFSILSDRKPTFAQEKQRCLHTYR